MKLQKLNEFLFYDKEQKNLKGYFYIFTLNDDNEPERVKNFYYDGKNDELFLAEE